jgi:hypothetical protein
MLLSTLGKASSAGTETKTALNELARFPARRVRLTDKKSRQIKILEHFLFGKPEPLFREML